MNNREQYIYDMRASLSLGLVLGIMIGIIAGWGVWGR